MSIKAKIEIDNNELKNGLKDAEKQASRSMKNIKNSAEGASGVLTKIGNAANAAANSIKSGFSGVATSISKIGPVGIAVAGTITLIGTAIYGVFSAINKLSTKLDSIAKSAKSVNMSSGAFQSLSYAARHAGVSMDNVVSMTTKLQAALHKASEGDVELVDMFHAMGLSVKELERSTPDKAFLDMTSAAKKFLDAGEKIPSKLRDIFGNRDFREFTKAAQADFTKLAMMANGLGFVVDANMLERAEGIADAVGDVNQGLLVTVTRLKLIQELFNMTEKTAKIFSKAIAPQTGRVLPEYKDRAEGIGNAAEKYATTDVDKLSRRQLMDVLVARQKDITSNPVEQEGLGILMSANDISKYENQLASMTTDTLRNAFKDSVKDINWDTIFEKESSFKSALFKVVEEQTKGAFKAANPDFWGRELEKKPLTEEEKNREKMLIIGERYNKEIERSIKYYSDILNKTGQLYDAEKIILNLEKQYNNVLDDEHKAILRSNAELLKRKALTVELKKIDESTDNERTRFYVETLAKVQGLAKGTIENVFNAVRNGVGMSSEQYMASLLRGRLFATGEEFKPFNTPSELYKQNPELYEKAYSALKQDVKDRDFGEFFGDAPYKAGDMVAAFNDAAEAVGEKTIKFSKEWFEVTDETFDAYMQEKVNEITKLRDAVKNSKNNIANRDKLLNNLKDFENTFSNLFSISTIINKALTNEGFFSGRKYRETGWKIDDRNKEENLELQLIEAQANKQQELVDLIQKKIILEKEGIEANKENLDIYKEHLETQIEINKLKGSAKLKDDLTGRLEEARIGLLEKQGRSQEANRLQALSQAQKIKGSALTADESDMVTRIADMIKSINEINIPSQIGDIIHTNELAAKGGFASSVTIERRDNAERILNVINKINEREEDIRIIIRDIHNNKL